MSLRVLVMLASLSLVACAGLPPASDETNRFEAVFVQSTNLFYHLVSRSFDPRAKTFGAPQLLVNGIQSKASIAFPRVSPDGTYLMMNSDVYSSVLSGHKMVLIVCDNGGYAVINRLQNAKGVPSNSIKVVTERGSTYLMGRVTRQEAA